MKIKSFLILVFFLLLSLSGGWIGAQATYPSIPTWYAQLQKPGFTPPNAIFGPVWTLLYCMMAVAAWLVWRKVGFQNKALAWYFLQLIANTLWSIFFFAWKRPDLALFDILLLWILIGITFSSFWKIDRKAALLFLPYWIWVSFAVCLNFAIWNMN